MRPRKEVRAVVFNSCPAWGQAEAPSQQQLFIPLCSQSTYSPLLSPPGQRFRPFRGRQCYRSAWAEGFTAAVSPGTCNVPGSYSISDVKGATHHTWFSDLRLSGGSRHFRLVEDSGRPLEQQNHAAGK